MTPTLLNYDHRHAPFMDNEGMRWITRIAFTALLVALVAFGSGIPADAQTSTATPTPTATPTITPTPSLGEEECEVYVLFRFQGLLAAGLDPVARQLFEETVERLGYTDANQPDDNIGFRWNLNATAVIADGKWFYRPTFWSLVQPFQRRFGFDETLMRSLVDMQVFGAGGCVREDSLRAALEYLADHRVEWERVP